MQEADWFYTQRMVQLSNRPIVSQNIINCSSEGQRQVKLRVSASYGAPEKQMRQVLTHLVAGHPLPHRQPDPMVHVRAYQDSAVEYLVWV